MKIPFTILLIAVSLNCITAQGTPKQKHGPQGRGIEQPKKEASQLRVSVKPGTSCVTIECKGAQPTAVEVNIKNPSGTLIYSESMTTSDGIYHTSIDIKAKPRGTYQIEVIAGDVRRVENVVLE